MLPFYLALAWPLVTVALSASIDTSRTLSVAASTSTPSSANLMAVPTATISARGDSTSTLTLTLTSTPTPTTTPIPTAPPMSIHGPITVDAIFLEISQYIGSFQRALSDAYIAKSNSHRPEKTIHDLHLSTTRFITALGQEIEGNLRSGLPHDHGDMETARNLIRLLLGRISHRRDALFNSITESPSIAPEPRTGTQLFPHTFRPAFKILGHSQQYLLTINRHLAKACPPSPPPAHKQQPLRQGTPQYRLIMSTAVSKASSMLTMNLEDMMDSGFRDLRRASAQ